MKLSQVLKNITPVNKKIDCMVKDLAYDSRQVKEGSLFFAIKGFNEDGHCYVSQAKDKGACAAVVERINKNSSIRQIKVFNTRIALSAAAANFYKNPTADLFLIGVTGTNGKTTTTFMLESIINTAGKKSALLGTINNRIKEKSFPVRHTTPESLDLQKIFSKIKKENVDSAVMEVSSHACLLHRVDNCHFDQVIFTNLTQDHLDFHSNIEKYFAAKKSLFDLNKKAVQIINIDDKYGKVFLNANRKVLTYGFKHEADFRASKVRLNNYGSQFRVNFLGQEFNFEIMLGGLFNIYNALAAITSSIKMGIKPETIQNGLYNLESVPGRFEIIYSDRGIKVIVDYAHTPDGLKNLLKSARKITLGKLITVFGCGGERDKTKRPLMGKIAYELSDKVIVTSDNPRSEDPEIIINQIIAEAQDLFITKVDRKEAIKVALGMARAKDTVIIAGKGHEETQEIKGKKLPFNDSKIVKELLNSDDKTKCF